MGDIVLSPSYWQVAYSVGASLSNSWRVDIPIGNGTKTGPQVDYIRSNYVIKDRPSVGHYLIATLAIELLPGSVIKQWAEGPDTWPPDGQDPNAPATCGLYLERKSLDLNKPNHRYWAAGQHRIVMANGIFTQQIPLTQGNWTHVFGQFEQAGFADLLANLGRVGYTFGGGGDYGHGVYLQNGKCRVSCIRYQFSASPIY